jgi:hypothetical protein
MFLSCPRGLCSRKLPSRYRSQYWRHRSPQAIIPPQSSLHQAGQQLSWAAPQRVGNRYWLPTSSQGDRHFLRTSKATRSRSKDIRPLPQQRPRRNHPPCPRNIDLNLDSVNCPLPGPPISPCKLPRDILSQHCNRHLHPRPPRSQMPNDCTTHPTLHPVLRFRPTCSRIGCLARQRRHRRLGLRRSLLRHRHRPQLCPKGLLLAAVRNGTWCPRRPRRFRGTHFKPHLRQKYRRAPRMSSLVRFCRVRLSHR